MSFDIFGEAKNLAGGTEYFINNAIVDGATPVSGLHATLENRICTDSTTINGLFYFCVHALSRVFL
jgi:hypothetical protein